MTCRNQLSESRMMIQFVAIDIEAIEHHLR